jgi:predicted anti-sigma-YlaC factor YlaD
MRCDDARPALSARLDGEPTLVDDLDLDAHLSTCGACRAWYATAEEVTRTARMASAPAPDLTARILAAVQTDAVPVRRRRRSALVLRWALGVLAVVQVLIAVPDLLGSVGHEAHAGREVAAFDIALAVGLLLVASYPEYARMFTPVVFTLVLCFASISALDLADGVITPSRVVGHVLALLQAVLVWLLARRVPGSGAGISPRASEVTPGSEIGMMAR